MSQSTYGKEPRVVPAQVDFLAIYNPTLSSSDESLRDQLVYYYTRRDRRKHDKDGSSKDNASDADEEENKRLRQIGLAQGMVNFANNFSTTSNVDSIETEKSRIVLHELEANWWILASIDLTQLPSSKTSRASAADASIEYSAREVAPAQLLITQLSQANSIFLLHHATKLQELFERAGRDTFCGLLERYWNRFLKDWDVLLHGNPAVDIYNATKLGGGGELGIGVGEEEWGSGEREVLEGFVERTTGLRDLIVGRYGLAPETDRASSTATNTSETSSDWLGTGNDTAAADGVIFSGKGLISKGSLRTLSKWMESIFKHGEDAYGVGENPSSRPRAKRKRRKAGQRRISASSVSSLTQDSHPAAKPIRKRAPDLRKKAMENNAAPPGIPAPLVGQVERSLDSALAGAEARKSPKAEKSQAQAMNVGTSDQDSAAFGTENMMKYLTLGYGTSWTLNPKGFNSEAANSKQKSSRATSQDDSTNDSTEDQSLREVDPTPEVSEEETPFRQKLEQSIGRFLIGLSGDLEQAELDIDTETDSDSPDAQTLSTDTRLFLRTLTVQMRQPSRQQRSATIRTNSTESVSTGKSGSNAQQRPPTSAEASIDGPQPNVTHEKVQIAIYVHQPFMFVFLFELHTPNLTIPSFYRSIHNQLGPLQKPLLRSTDPSRTAERIAEATGEKSSVVATAKTLSSPTAGSPIYDLIYDSAKRTIRTSIPNIPVPGSLAAEGLTSNASSALSISGSWYTLGIPIGLHSQSPAPNSGSSTRNSASKSNSGSNRLIKSSWSRTEALNAHTQVLNTYLATRSGLELEHTAKTSRGWWILWMKIPASSRYSIGNKTPRMGIEEAHEGDGIHAHDHDRYHRPSELERTSSSVRSTHKEAFLVRKAPDSNPSSSTGFGGGAASERAGAGPGRWLLREQKRDFSGASSTGGGGSAASARGVSEGVGVDARRWVEGLLTLTR